MSSGSIDISRLDALFENALGEGVFPGAALLVGTPDGILLRKAWGVARYDRLGPVDDGVWWDLASLTKPLVTASLCMRTVADGILSLEDPLTRFFPRALVPTEKREIRIRHLLAHSSGLPAHFPYYKELIHVPPARRASTLLAWVLDAPLLGAPGSSGLYSDLGFILLGMVLERIAEQPLDRQAHGLLFDPCGIADLDYRRLSVAMDSRIRPPELAEDSLQRRFAATQDCPWRGRTLQGEVDDENAYCMEGVAGHAGLFGTVEGVYKWLAFLWGVYKGRDAGPHWRASVVREFWTKQSPAPDRPWTLGFDTPSGARSSAGVHFSPHTVGHLGSTGTSFWMDLEREIVVVLLTNRVHPTRANEKLKEFRPLPHNFIMESLYGAG